MQLCEFCTQYDTCKLDKRLRGRAFASCDSFERQDEIPQDRYEIVKTNFLRLRDDPEVRPKIERHTHIDIPMEITEKNILEGFSVFDIPRDLHEIFLKTKPEGDEIKKFLDGCAVARAYRLVFILNNDDWDPPEDVTARDFLAVHADLKEIVDRWVESPTDFGTQEIPLNLPRRSLVEEAPDIATRVYRNALGWYPQEQTDIFRLDAWIRHCLQFSIKRTKEGAIKPYARFNPRYWWGVLYFLFAMDVIECQEWKRCPVCETIFKPKQRENASPFCQRKCLMAAKRDPERYGITTWMEIL